MQCEFIVVLVAVGSAIVASASACSSDDPAPAQQAPPDASVDRTEDDADAPSDAGVANDSATTGRSIGIFGGEEYRAAGPTATFTSRAYRANILAGGTVGTWKEVPHLSFTRYLHAFASRGALLFAAGVGTDIDGGRNGPSLADVFTATLDVRPWTMTTPLPYPIRDACLVVDADNLYVLGGRFENSVPHVQRGRVAPSGVIAWTFETPLPQPRERAGLHDPLRCPRDRSHRPAARRRVHRSSRSARDRCAFAATVTVIE